MARNTGSNYIEREIGDACPRQCPGLLQEPRVPPTQQGTFLECETCRRHFPYKYKVPADAENREGIEQALYLPDEIVMALIHAKHKHEMAMLFPNPDDRKDDEDWFEKLNTKNQEGWKEETRAALEPVWPMIAEWFGGVPNYAAAMRQRDAARAIAEIAIPSLRHCEEKYGHDDQARLNLEAVIGEA